MYKCKRCLRLLPRPSVSGDGKHLEVDGDSYEIVDNFFYLGDMLDSNGGAELAATKHVQTGWSKFWELSPFLSSRVPSLKMKGRVFDACVRKCQ